VPFGTVQVVPEPASLLLLGSGFLVVAWGRRRARK
jgi:PEP-CTERM motif